MGFISKQPLASCLQICVLLILPLCHTHSLSLTQLRTYQEDFEAERRDRERISDEKQSAALRYEAEITSLRLQLDRCRNELAHYTAESSRLAQQLRLKNQYEEDQFKKHLESRVSNLCVKTKMEI